MSEAQFTEKQNKLLAKVKSEALRIEQLTECYKEFVDSYQEKINCQQLLEAENETLKRQCNDIEEKQVKHLWEYEEALKKFSELNLELEDQKNLSEQLFFILGYNLTSLETINQTEQVATFHYNAECFVKLRIGGVRPDLLQIQPMHPNFDAIQEMLQKTSNISGLLANLRKFFDIATKLKDEN